MSRDLIIEMTPFGARAALMRHGKLQELRFADGASSDIRGQIFLARVKNVEADPDAAFVDCGQGQTAYLSGRDGRYVSGKRRDMPLADQITEGQAILVQGAGMSRDGKNPKVTSDIQLTGMFQVFRPRRRSVRLSSKLSDSGQSDRLLRLAKASYPDGGVIYRGSASAADDAELEAESEKLKTLWREIEDKVDSGQAPACVFARGDPLDRLLQDSLKADIDRIIAADRIVHTSIRTFLETWLPALEPRLECEPGAFEGQGVNDELARANEPLVDLRSGGSIIIETTAALTAIDVNSGTSRPRDANIEAAYEIARQLRLRRIGGTIVVDFIDLSSQGERDALLSALDEGFAHDPAAVRIYPPTPLGLVQISRQHLGHSLTEHLKRPCPSCDGSGRVESLRVVTERLLAEARGMNATSVNVAPDLYSYIEREAIGSIRAYIKRYGLLTPQISRNDSLPPGTYQLT
ncbi:MAG: ribonuclease E/G [Pseudomonadota bacterium]